MLEALQRMGDFNGLALDQICKSKAFASGNVTAHTAIIPPPTTAKVPELNDMNEYERRVYLAIV
ncbi:hypothetical protein [Candidatus Williamhamiltonella defendens]|uniref:hypothetical protein n=1 Tax=Candidatus Williamhamiltonella defendens TaxID=138072 RepID=UPI00130E6A40|nr:hypothetical protein [Candidatus Hamiltonella defensa]